MERYFNIKGKFILGLCLVVFLLVGCAGIQEKWNNLNSDEKARIILNDLQSQLNTLFDTGKAFVVANPQHTATWKTKIIPAFDLANKSLLSAMNLSKLGQITPDEVYGQVQPVLNSCINLLVQIGALKKSDLLPDEYQYKTRTVQAAMDPGMIIVLINGLIMLAMQLWSSARKVFGSEEIPEWDEIIAKNKALQDKIDAEKEIVT